MANAVCAFAFSSEACAAVMRSMALSTLVGAIGFEQGFEFDLFLMQGGVDVDQLYAAFLEDLLNFLNLAVIKANGLSDIGFLPPPAWWKHSVNAATRVHAVSESFVGAAKTHEVEMAESQDRTPKVINVSRKERGV